MGIKEQKFPAFCRGNTAAASGKGGIGEVNVPISCGGVSVNPGDIIIGDADGTVVVPWERTEKVLEISKEKEKQDQERAFIWGNPEALRSYLDKLFPAM